MYFCGVYSLFKVRTASFWQTASFSAAGSLLLPIVPILPPAKPIVNDFSILHLLYIYRYSVIYPPHIYNSMPSTCGVQFQAFCITIFYVNALYDVFGRSAWFYIPKGKNGLQRKFDGLVTNNIFVIIVTLIITFYIWIVKCCHQIPCRYSFVRRTPCTATVLPLFSAKNIHQYHLQYFPGLPVSARLWKF